MQQKPGYGPGNKGISLFAFIFCVVSMTVVLLNPLTPSTAKCHDLVSVGGVSGEEGGQPLHELLRGEAQNDTVGQDAHKHHCTHHIIPHPNVTCPMVGRGGSELYH